LKYNEKKFYGRNVGWDAFDEAFVSHGKEKQQTAESSEKLGEDTEMKETYYHTMTTH
jgi:hypothetical protein